MGAAGRFGRIAVLALCAATVVAAPAEARHRPSMVSLIRGMHFPAPRAQRAQAVECADRAADPTTTDPARIRKAVRCLLNDQRAAFDLGPLEASEQLRSAGQGLAQDMVARHFFDHVSPGGGTVTDRVRATGYVASQERWTLGETIGWGTGSLATPAGIVDAFMNSPPHRAIILTPGFREVGVGMSTGIPPLGDIAPGATYALDFGWTGSPQR